MEGREAMPRKLLNLSLLSNHVVNQKEQDINQILSSERESLEERASMNEGC